MNILVIADEEAPSLWDYFRPEKLKDVDLILSCGDLNPKYLSFLATFCKGPVLYVHGNHDDRYEKTPPEGCICIEDKIYEYKGIRIMGLGGSYRYSPGINQYTERKMRNRIFKMWFPLWRKKGFDILLTHAAAYGVDDANDWAHMGFECFVKLLDIYRPKYYIHGHIHLNYGGGHTRRQQYGETEIINGYQFHKFEYETGKEKICGKEKTCIKEKTSNKGNELSEIRSKREKQEIREFQAESAVQYEKNKKHFEQNQAIYQNAIRRLTEKLKICFELQEETFPERAAHGKLNPREVWKAVYLDNPRVFERKEEVEIPGFSVDILIDASSSRKQMQEQIAAQAYILAKSLERCDIPAQIYSYCSIRGYTILRIFKSYEEEQNEDELFRYVAAGNNRDGLALRAAGHMMESSEKSKRILLVLTDASPQDDQDSGEGAFYKNKEYTDLLAVQDTAKEVQALKQKGVRVIGIFMGSPRAGEVAGQIFGQNLVKIRNISEFSEAVGRVLQEEI